jgi:hypothetical protein
MGGKVRLGLALLLAVLVSCKGASSDHGAPLPEKASSPPTISAGSPCVLGKPGGYSVLIFPEEWGFDEYAKAKAAADKKAMSRAIEEHHGFSVLAETRCAWLEQGRTRSKVRVSSGPFRNDVGWVPNEELGR